MDQLYWGKEDDSSYAWFVSVNYGFVYRNIKNGSYRVRAVAPVPAASAR